MTNSLHTDVTASTPISRTQAAQTIKPTDSATSTPAKTENPSRLPADTLSLSPNANLLQVALHSPDVRLDRIASLQQAITAGTYTVSSSDVADKIISTLLEG